LINSVQPELFVAFVDGEKVEVRTCACMRAHDRNLNKLTREFIANADAFAVVTGPGSWTGSRVGVVAVKAYSLASGKPIIELRANENLEELIAEARQKFAMKNFTDVRNLQPYYDSEFKVTVKK